MNPFKDSLDLVLCYIRSGNLLVDDVEEVVSVLLLELDGLLND